MKDMKKTSATLIVLVILFSLPIYGQEDLTKAVMKESFPPSGKRSALVLGNSNYLQGRLKNPANDAEDMAKALRELGFEVTLKKDVRFRSDMVKLIEEFGQKITLNSTALFFYAGHGAQVNGKNYLIPTAAMINDGEDLKDQGVSLDLVIGSMSGPDNHFNIVIIDACRSDLLTKRIRDIPRGLAAVVGPRGTYIAYATAPGSVASDGKGRNGLFTGHLLNNLRTPGLKIEEMFKRVRRDVINDSENDTGQMPWDASSMTEEFAFNPRVDMPQATNPRVDMSQATFKLTSTPLPSRPYGGSDIRITLIPIYDPIGGEGTSAKIEGEVSGAVPQNAQVVLYSWTDKGYIQPTQAQPFTEIAPDGKWSAEIHTGTRYAALLVKPGFKPRFIMFNLPTVGGDVIAVASVTGAKP
jgi:Uncharacterized protein containing caspase domain